MPHNTMIQRVWNVKLELAAKRVPLIIECDRGEH